MKILKLLIWFILLFSAAFYSSTYAATFYRHPPFTISVLETDSVIVEYDFANKNGLRCSALQNTFWADFIYKGRSKSAVLPVILENDHVPKKENEELANPKGRLSIRGGGKTNLLYELSCRYVNEN